MDAAKASAVIAEARTWLGTPWHHEARVKGAGVDCAQFLIAVFSAVGLVPEFTPEHYPMDWFLHQDKKRFLEILLQHADEVEGPAPGRVAMFSFGRHEAHGAIVTEWPMVIHAYRKDRCVTISDVEHSELKERLTGFYEVRS